MAGFRGEDFRTVDNFTGVNGIEERVPGGLKSGTGFRFSGDKGLRFVGVGIVEGDSFGFEIPLIGGIIDGGVSEKRTFLDELELDAEPVERIDLRGFIFGV